jgi:hypothetical protein
MRHFWPKPRKPKTCTILSARKKNYELNNRSACSFRHLRAFSLATSSTVALTVHLGPDPMCHHALALHDNRLANQRGNFGAIGRVATFTPRTGILESTTNMSLSRDWTRDFSLRANHESAGPDVLSRPIT